MLLRICSDRRAAPFSPDLACASITLVMVLVFGLKSGSPSLYLFSIMDRMCSALVAAPRSPDLALPQNSVRSTSATLSTILSADLPAVNQRVVGISIRLHSLVACTIKFVHMIENLLGSARSHAVPRPSPCVNDGIESVLPPYVRL